MRTDLQIIRPRALEIVDIKNVTKLIRNIRAAVAQDIAIDFDVTHQTFKRKMKAEIRNKGDNRADIVISDEIYYFLNGGTDVRYATMTPDWRSKTAPRVIASRQGSGRVAYVRKDVPRPGIEARHFDEEIAKKWNKLLPGVVERMVLAEL